MSQKEFQRAKVIENAVGGRLSVREASRLLHLSERQVQRLKRRYQPDSVGWVQHGNRGRSMPWALPVRQIAVCGQCILQGAGRASRQPAPPRNFFWFAGDSGVGSRLPATAFSYLQRSRWEKRRMATTSAIAR